MSKSKSKPKRKGRAKKRPRALRRNLNRVTFVLRGLALGFALFIFLSLAWIIAYAVTPPPGTLLMAERDGQGQTVRYDWRDLDNISPHLVRAVIAAEDSKFCTHKGFDFEAIEAALKEAENGGRLRGASTISQQTAKNAFLWPGRSWLRKGVEVWFTWASEALWTKRRTMALYLNIAEWGDGLFGAEAAARARFGKPADALTKREAALLAAVLPNPNEWRVDPPGPYVSRRTATILKRMDIVQREGLDGCVLNR